MIGEAAPTKAASRHPPRVERAANALLASTRATQYTHPVSPRIQGCGLEPSFVNAVEIEEAVIG